MDVQKIVEFLDQYPTWFKVVAVAAFAFVLLGLLTFRQPKNPAQGLGTLVSPAHASTSSGAPPDLGSSAIPQTFADFFKYREALDGRFLELQEFGKRLEGKGVVWEGFIGSVSDGNGRSEFPIIIVVASDESRQPKIGAVLVPDSLRAKAYSFRRGDRIRFEGIISSASNALSVEAKAIEFVPAKSGS